MKDDAPVSRKQANKRKAIAESQVPNNGEQIRDLQQTPIVNT